MLFLQHHLQSTMSEVAQQVGQQIREARKAQGITQAELAEQLGVSQVTVNRYEDR